MHVCILFGLMWCFAFARTEYCNNVGCSGTLTDVYIISSYPIAREYLVLLGKN
jgi:hypothetical protein